MTTKQLSKTLFLTLILFCGAYVYFINTMILDVAGREKALASLSDLSSETAALEAKYVELSGRVTLDLAYGLGFQETGNHTGFALAAPGLVAANN